MRNLIVSRFLVSVVLTLFSSAYVLAESQYEAGVRLFKAQKFAQAKTAFENSINSEGSTATKYYYLGLSYYYKGQGSKTSEIFNKLIKEFPDSPLSKRAETFLGKSKSKSGSSKASSAGDYGSSLPEFTRVRYKEIDKDIIIETQVNGRPISMVFDTGAPDTWIGTNHLHSLGLPMPTGKFRKMKSQLGEDAEYRYWNYRLDLKVGPILRKNFPVLVQENRKGMPLIGQTFVKGYQYRIDHGSRELCFQKKKDNRVAYSTPPKLGRNEVEFETKDFDYVWVKAMVNGKPCKMIFDTGASTVYFPESYVKKYDIRIPPNAKVHTYKSAKPSKQGFVSRLQVGPIDAHNVEVRVADWSNMEEPLLGVSFYKNWEYTIDRDRKVIKFLRR